MMNTIEIYAAKPKDLQGIYRLIKELALYEKEPAEPSNSFEKFYEEGSGESPYYKAFVAKENSAVVGAAVYYYGYSTWKGKMIYLDDLIVKDSHRRRGIGRLLINALIKEATANEVNQLRWHVLDWNTPAIDFYKTLNASLDASWITVKIEKELLSTLNAQM